MDTGRGDARPRERRPAAAKTRPRRLLGARPALAGRPRLVLARGRRGPRARVLPTVGVGLRRLARARVDDLVQWRDGVDRAQLRPPLGRARAGPRRSRVCRRGRLAPRAHLRGALTRRDPAGRGPRPARRRSRRPRRDLYADVPRGRRRLARMRAHRRRADAALLRLRGSRRAAAPARRRGEGGDHRRLLVAAREPTADASDRGRGRPRCPVRRARGHLGAGCRLGRDRRRESGRAGSARGRQRAPVPAHLHLGHDRKAEGRPARPGRLPGLDRPRGRLPGRRPPRDVLHFSTDMGWIMGPGPSSAAARWLHARLRRGRARPPPDRLWRLVEDEGVSVLGLSPTLVRALIRTATRWPTSPRCACSSPPASPGTRRHTAGSSSGWAAAAARSSTARGHRGGRLLPFADAGDPDQGVLARRARPGDGRGRRRRRGRSLVGAGEVGELVCRRPSPG